MMKRFVFAIFAGVVFFLWLLTFDVAAQGPEPRLTPTSTPTPVFTPPLSSTYPSTQPTSTLPSAPSGHIPFDPATLSPSHSPFIPIYRGYGRPGVVTQQPQPTFTKPDGIDLDVIYIQRTPSYNRYDVQYASHGYRPYLQIGTENDKRWPAPGEIVTFTAHIINKGNIASGSFAFRWQIDGATVLTGTHASLAPGEEGVESYQWAWAHTLDGDRLLGEHTVRFTVDADQAIAETYESNNSVEDRTDALSLFLPVTAAAYAALEMPTFITQPFSAEDWLRKQISEMNAAFVRSIYPSAPNGIIERVRLDRIVVVPTVNDCLTLSIPTMDGGFCVADDFRVVSGGYNIIVFCTS